MRNALARLTDASIPDADKSGVKTHLQKHLDDFNESNPNEKEPDNDSDDKSTDLDMLKRDSGETAKSERQEYLALLRRLNK